MLLISRFAGLTAVLMLVAPLAAADLPLQLRSGSPDRPGQRTTRAESWPAEKTALIVCDVWDLHHSLNAVRRLEEFAPRLNAVIKEARRRGVTIIHAPSDCMPAYVDHPARQRALAVPPAVPMPEDIATWCSRIPAEEQAIYPIDQSDGGDDDEPGEHAPWAAKLTALGRNPGLPWQRQSDLIEIDAGRDYISDRGDEVWSILASQGIERVILTGVHTNMCVLGRPFGLRQMVRCGKEVVLLRDLTDSMYNPRAWPYVDHFTGHDLIVAHVERYVCPTITSDQLLGGEVFRSRFDRRETFDVDEIAPDATRDPSRSRHWSIFSVPSDWSATDQEQLKKSEGVAWYRATLRIPSGWLSKTGGQVHLLPSAGTVRGWLNGVALETRNEGNVIELQIPLSAVTVDDANLLVLRCEHPAGPSGLRAAPILLGANASLKLKGRWQVRMGDDPSWSNMPLPAKFGTGTDIVFTP